MTENITWTCDTCQQPMTGADGLLHIQPWRTADRHAQDIEDPDVFGAHHWRCMPPNRVDEEGYIGDYSIDTGQVANRSSLSHWTRHLAGKNWYDVSGWREMVLRSAGIDVARDAARERMYRVSGAMPTPPGADTALDEARS